MIPNLSIIVPVYNVSKYLRQCLETILCQNYEDFEVLIIDDGSTDSSGRIADETALRDSRVRVIHKENAGLPQARRTGVENARGNYIGFVDGDDYIEASMFQMLMQKAAKTNADIVCCAFYLDYDGRRPLRKSTFRSGDAIFTSWQALTQLWQTSGIAPYMWNKIYRKTLFEDIEFSTGNPVGEDYFLNVQLLGKSDKIVQINKPGYHYMLRAGSMSRSGYNWERKQSLNLYFKWRSTLLSRYESCKPQITAYHLREELAVLVAMGRNQVIDIDEATRIGQDVRKNLKYLLRSKPGIPFIIAGGIAAVDWKWLVYISILISRLKQK